MRKKNNQQPTAGEISDVTFNPAADGRGRRVDTPGGAAGRVVGSSRVGIPVTFYDEGTDYTYEETCAWLDSVKRQGN